MSTSHAARALRATYRVQLNAGFTLRDAQAIVSYLHRLGASHLYASPVLQARKGSVHGYDVVNPTAVNRELCGEDAFIELCDALAEREMGMLLDFVPNHMCANDENPFWDDVLAHGEASRFARWFDIDWSIPRRQMRHRVLLPALHEEIADALGARKLAGALVNGIPRIQYGGENGPTFPLDPATIPDAVRDAIDLVPPRWRSDAGALAETLAGLESLPPRDATNGNREELARPLLERLARLAQSPGAHDAMTRALADLSAPPQRDRFRALIDAQAYRLAYWRRSARELNYRRFFDVNDLVALRQEDPRVFEETHARVLGWAREGRIHGLRIDHIDGLRDPAAYLARLRSALPAPVNDVRFPIVVEKILIGDERLDTRWPVEGTTGYDFLNELESIFVHPEGAAAVRSAYASLQRTAEGLLTYEETSIRMRLRILRGGLSADVRRLERLAREIAADDMRVQRVARTQLTAAIVALLACLPVYRTYITPAEVHAIDRQRIDESADIARKRGLAPTVALGFFRDALVGEGGLAGHPLRAELVARFQQLSGPATAKGVEDTALYRWVPLVSLNEVGGEPDRPLEDAVQRLHAGNTNRATHWPLGLLTTSTHDTKRSADVRARLDVLSEIPAEWERAVTAWIRSNREMRKRVAGRFVPDTPTEYLFYQTLVGLHPWPGEAVDAAARAALATRAEAYMLKAAREAKVHTSWVENNPDYEKALSQFVRGVLEPRRPGSFPGELHELVARIARAGAWNALSRTLVHLTSPGTPDVYQGDELWNFTLVDPDNRRQLDYAQRAELLTELEDGFASEAREAFVSGLVTTPFDGRIKMHVVRRALAARAMYASVFARGSYIPLQARGASADHVFAFRREADTRVITAVPRLTISLSDGAAPLGKVWRDGELEAGITPGSAWRNLMTGERLTSSVDGGFALAELFARFPVALLVETA